MGHLTFDLTNTRFYQLTWPTKQKLMYLFDVDTVEEAAQIFDLNPADYLWGLVYKTKPTWWSDDSRYELDLEADLRGDLYELFLSRYYPAVLSAPITLTEKHMDISQFLASRDWDPNNPQEMDRS